MDELLDGIVPAGNILSISSHVVHGSVGNDALQFPLNLRNWNIDCIYTTNLSAHPGHGQFTGVKVEPTLIKDLISGLRDLELDNNYQVIIIGYIASSDNLQTIWNDVLLNKSIENSCIIIDPIMGDNGKIYVSNEIVELYIELLTKNEVIIDLLTPNQFEMELLSGITINSWKSMLKALDVFCSKYTKVKNVVITSVIIDNIMYCVGASKSKVFYYKVEQVEAIFSGSGDLFLGILTDEFIKTNKNLQISLCKTINTVAKVLKLSYKIMKNDKFTSKLINGKPYIPDLKLIESKNCLLEDSEVYDPVYLK